MVVRYEKWYLAYYTFFFEVRSREIYQPFSLETDIDHTLKRTKSDWNKNSLRLALSRYLIVWLTKYVIHSKDVFSLSIRLTNILFAVKLSLQKFCKTRVYNHIWKLKNCKELLDNFRWRSFFEIISIKTFDTTILHVKFGNHLK